MAAVCASVSMGFTYIKAPLNTWDARSQGPKLSLLLSQQLCIDTTQDYMNHVLSTFGIIYWTSWPSTSLTFSNLRFRVRVRDYSRPLAQFRVRDWDESWAERLGVSSPRRETREILLHISRISDLNFPGYIFCLKYASLPPFSGEMNGSILSSLHHDFYRQNEKQQVSNDSVLEAVRIFSRTPHKDKDGRMCWREGKKVDQVH